jgi:hypothetical protein
VCPLINRQRKMKKTNYAWATAASILLSGCASPPQYKPDAEQLRVGADLLTQDIPAGKALMEFTTNTVAHASLKLQTGDDLCQPDKSEFLAGARRQRVITDAEKAVYTTGNILSLGLINALGNPLETKTPASRFFYVDSGQRLNFNAMSIYSAPNHSSSTCGPIHLGLVPEAGAIYKINFINVDNRCGVVLTRENRDSTVVPRHSRWTCSKGFLGMGGGRLTSSWEVEERPVTAATKAPAE